MATPDDLLLNRSKDPRLGFLHNTNRRKVIDGNSQSPSTYHPRHAGVSSPGNNLLTGASSSDQSRGPRTWPRIRGTLYSTTYCVGESSQVSNPALEATSSSRDLTEPIGHIQVKSRTVPSPQHQSNKIRKNKDSASLVKKSGINAILVSRLSKRKEHATQPPKDPISLFKRGSRTTLESKQLTVQKGTTQPLEDPAGLPKKSAINRIRTSIHFIKKVIIQPPRKPTEVKKGGASRILASKHVMQKKETARPPKDPVGFVKDIGTSRIPASKHVKQKKETARPPKDPVGFVKDIGTSRIPTSSRSMQKKKAIHSPKDSAAWVKKSETTTKIPTLKQFTQKKEKNQPSKGSAGLVSEIGTRRTPSSKLVRHKNATIPDNPRRVQHICKDHIVWEGFDERIEPLERSCLLCDGDLANEPENDPDIEPLNPAENAVLSCGHVFHSLCLLLATAEEESRDPPCIICASLLS